MSALAAKVDSQSSEVASKIGEVAKRVEEVADTSAQLARDLPQSTQTLMNSLAQQFSAMLDAKLGPTPKRDGDETPHADARPAKVPREGEEDQPGSPSTTRSRSRSR